MIELTIKTLDAQNHHFTVPNDCTVEQLKEHIADTIQIPSDSQRCIYLGQVLENDTKLSDYDVNGKVIHVVQRPPPSSVFSECENSNSNSNTEMPYGRRSETHTGTMYLGAMAFPSDFGDAAAGLTFVHPRTNLSVSRLAVARNLLRRAMTLISQLENENYFNSPQDQDNISNPASNLTDDLNNAENGNGLDQPEVEIRIELSNAQHDSVSESIARIDNNSTPGLSNSNVEQQSIDDSATDNTSNSQPETENSAGNTSRDDGNRRRGSRTPMMATVMGAVLHSQVRLIPFMRLLRQYLLQDTAFGPELQTTHTEQQVQTLYNSVSELMHSFSHIYHALSDIMCDFSQPPPRTLRCRPVVLQQQHATVLRSGSRGRIMRSPLVALARSAPTSAASSLVTSGNISVTTATVEARPEESSNSNGDVGTPSVEVVIEEADTTNMQDNNGEIVGLSENMDTSEPVLTNGGSNMSNMNVNTGEPSVTVRGRNGNTYFIQSVPSIPDGVVPEGIRINSVEATILTANEDIAAALTSGTNQRWRAGILPAEVLQNMIGLINQFRQYRQQRGTPSDRSRTQNLENGNQSSNSTNNVNDSSSQGQNNTSETPFEYDISGLSRTFDPFLPCHSHHIHPVLRSNNARSSTARNSSTRASSSDQSAQSQTQQSTSQFSQESSTQESQTQEASVENESQQTTGRSETETGFSLPDMPRNVTQFFNSIFPGFNIGNVMIRRSPADVNSSDDDINNQTRHSARARVQLSSNLNAIFPGAIQIEIDPLASNIQTNVVPNNNAESTERRPRSRRTRTACRRPRANATSNVHADPAAAEVAYLTSINEEDHLSLSSTSSSSSTSSLSSSDEDITEIMGHEKKKAKKEKQNEFLPCTTVKNLYSVMQKETVRHLMGKKVKTPKNEIVNNFPLYREDQEASLLEVINSVISNISFHQIIKGNKTNIDQFTSSIRSKIRSYLTEQCTISNNDKESLLDAVNVLINNDLYKMKCLLDSDSVKQEIDMVSTICKFNQYSVPELIEYIMKSEDLNEAELKKFCQTFQAYIAQLLTLFVHCISGEEKSINIRKVLGSVIEEITKRLPNDELLLLWLRKDLINHVISYSKICQPDNLPSFMKHYVVYRLPPVMPIKCTVATAMTNISNDIPHNAEQTQPMEVEEIQSSSSTSSEASFMSLNSEEAHIQNEQRNDNLNANNENTSIIPIPTAESLPEVVLDSEEWHQTFPSEWVPIIARDIHRLRRQGSEPPFSDAYLSGMPTKRRKLIKNNKPDVNSSEDLVTCNITSAVDSAGFSANALPNQINEINRTSDEGVLSQIVKEELKENVRENIVQQTDFLPHRFPDSTKYFMEK